MHPTQVLVHSHLNGKLQQRCLRLLSKICKAQRIMPTSYILQPEFIRARSVQDRGGFSEVSDGEYLGYTVAIKDLKMNEGNFDKVFKVRLTNPARTRFSTLNQRFCREIVGWKHLSHPNILPLLGVSVSTNPYRFRIISEWMPNGNVMLYTRSNPEANRLQLVSPFPVSPDSPY
jgi:serine/threonine protein kinase